MSAGAGTKAYQDALELERWLISAFGPDFREKALVLPLGRWPLRDAFEECGLRDPRAPAPSSEAYGLWQMMPTRPVPATHMLAGAQRTPEEAVRAGLERIRREYGGPEQQWRRYARSTRWPVSPPARSPHGDAVLSLAGRR